MTDRQGGAGLVGTFARHPVAANLFMMMMILAGAWGLIHLNKQFFPNFDIDVISVRVEWTGASAEDVEQSVTVPLEQSLKNVDRLKRMTSTSAEGISAISLEFEDGTDMGLAREQVEQEVDLTRNLPSNAEQPEITRVVRYESVSKVLLTGDTALAELTRLARRYERELLERGIAKVTLTGIPEDEIAIQVPTEQLASLGLSLATIGERVAAASGDIPAGTAGLGESSRQLRILDQRRSVEAFNTLPIAASQDGRRLTVGDIAEVERRPKRNQVTLHHKGLPAVELALRRAEDSDSLDAARIFAEWLEETRPTLPPGLKLVVFDERWEPLQQRINLLLKNGASGLLLVILVLFFFMNARVAWWVTVGIPVSFMATLGLMLWTGASINMLSLFALIMTLGIIVDDAIVVGEEAMTRYQRGSQPLDAALGGAKRMLAPVMSSSLTTIAAFMPLMLIGDIIGAILFAIPSIVICVVIASVFESFFVLPGHLRHSFERAGSYRPSAIRRRCDALIDGFREKLFRPFVSRAIDHWPATLGACAGLILLTVTLFRSGLIEFNFFPTPEGQVVFANVAFVSGTPAQTVETYLDDMEAALWDAEASLGGGLISAAVTRLGSTVGSDFGSATVSEQVGSIQLELIDPDQREVRNPELIRAWRERLPVRAGIENVNVSEARAGPPGRDVEIQVFADDSDRIKAAINDMTAWLGAVPGVSGINDDMPYGSEQLIFSLTPAGEALGLSVDDVGRQLRAAYDGYLVQIFPEGQEEVEVRVMLPDAERDRLGSLEQFEIVLPGGGTVPLGSVAESRPARGFETLRHVDGRLAATLVADVDPATANANQIRAEMAERLLPALRGEHGVDFSFEGRAAEQRDTLSDMARGAVLALVLIYLILAWVFGSYGWPLIVMSVIPLGLVGAVWGHFLLGVDLTILSLFGFFGLAGIVVNDSIILVVYYRDLRGGERATRDAVVEAACQRLRAVLLTSLTTIGGLLPLLFETSLQAQFLIPMAVSIIFGLSFATLIVLILVPSLLYLYETLARSLKVGYYREQPAA